VSSVGAQEERPTMPLWTTAAPGETGEIGPERTLPSRPGESQPVIRLTDVSRPTLTLYRPAKPDPKRTAVIVAPGGGYHILAYNHEGTEICEWLNSIGITAVLLKYRVPRRSEGVMQSAPLADAQRAIRSVRAHAEDWGIDPNRVGMLGFSAGGHLTVMAGLHGDQVHSDPVDEIDRGSAALNFMIPIYPAYLLDKKTQQLDEHVVVDAGTPPAFIAITFDDAERAVGSALLMAAMKRVDVPCELHVFRNGGHGYGMRQTGDPVSQWPALCEDWLVASELLTAKNEPRPDA